MKIRIIASSDIHGYIYPLNYADNSFCDIGMLKLINTAYKHKTENTLFIDNGDTIQGSPLINYFYSHNKNNNPITELINNNYDYVNLGNHDFSYGSDVLLDYINNINNKCICGNVLYKGKHIGKEYVVHEFDKDNRVALIGAVTQYTSKFESKETLEGLQFIDAYEYIRETIKIIKEKENVKAIIVIYHGGFEADFEGKLLEKNDENEGYKIIKNLDFDILISGHQHRSIYTKCFNKLISQTNQKGKEFALIDFDLDNKEGEVKLIQSNGEVSKEDLDKYQQLQEETQVWLDQNIVDINSNELKILDGLQARINKHKLISFINNVQLSKTHSELSATSLFNNATGFNSNITMRDLLSTYIYENTLVKVRIDGRTLKKYLEKCAEYFDVKNNEVVVSERYLKPVERHFDYDMVDGIDYTIKASNKVGERIVELKYKDKNVKENDEFTLTINNYRYGGAGGFEFMNELEVIETYDEDMVSLLYKYLKNNNSLEIKHKDNIKVII